MKLFRQHENQVAVLHLQPESLCLDLQLAPHIKVFKGKCVSPRWGSESLQQRARLCSDLLSKTETCHAALQVSTCMRLCGRALFRVTFYLLALPLLVSLQDFECWRYVYICRGA